MGPSDDELMRLLGQGDAAAFERLVRRWEEPVWKALARLAGRGEVEDLRQEVFLRVYGARGRYRERGPFSAWLFAIVRNVARDAVRRGRLRRWLSLDGREPESPRAGPHAAAGRGELEEIVDRAVAGLPPELRGALVLKHFGGLTFAEMAAELGLPASTLKSRLRAALERLRADLRQAGIDGKEFD